jgi:hypothetical protein
LLAVVAQITVHNLRAVAVAVRQPLVVTEALQVQLAQVATAVKV